MRLLHIIFICNSLHSSCSTQFSVRNEILEEHEDWVEPGSKNFQSGTQVENVPCTPCEQPADVFDLRKDLRIAEKQLNGCEAKLKKLQADANVSENWKLTRDMVYLKKLAKALLNRLEGIFVARKGTPTRLQLSLSQEQRIEIKDLVKNLDQDSASQLVETMQNIIDNAEITHDRDGTRFNFRQVYNDLRVFYENIDLLTAVNISILVWAIILVYIAVKSRSILVTLTWLLMFGTWISHSWHSQNMLRLVKYAQLPLSLTKKQRIEIKDLVENLDQNSAAELIKSMQKVINQTQFTYGVGMQSNLRLLYNDFFVVFEEMDLFTAIQISIVVCAIIFVYIAATCRSKVVTLSYLLIFGMWISYFWHWQNMLRKSQVYRHVLSQRNPCEDSRSFYNPLRYFRTSSEECEKYLRKMFTPMFWEFTPIEVLVDMIATYTSNVVSVLVINIMGAVGDAIREFADKQSWFSIVPAFAVLLVILLIVLFKLSGCGVSLFYGAMHIVPSAEPAVDNTERSRPPSIYESLSRSSESRRCGSYKQVGWKEDHRSKKKKRRHTFSVGLDNDSDNYLTAGES